MRSNAMGVTSIAAAVLLVTFALVIDATQWFIGWAFFVIGMVAPTATGAVIGGYYCPTGILNSACIALAGGVGFLINLIPGVAQVGGAIGTAVGMAVSLIIGWMLGFVLILWLSLTGNLRWKYVGPAFLGKSVPLLDYLPTWTAATVMCVFSSKTKAVATSAVVRAAGTLEEVPGAAGAFRAARSIQRTAPPREEYEGELRAGAIRSQTLRDISQGIKAVRPATTESAPATTRNDDGSLTKRYGFVA